MEQMTIDGATIAWSDTGAGDPTLLVHAGVFGAWFEPVANHLLPLTHPRAVADLVTTGRSTAARWFHPA